MNTTASTRLDIAIDQHAAAAARVAATRRQIAELQETLELQIADEVAATIAVVAARAAAASDDLPAGTRVAHRSFDILGTVVPSDGTGISVLQDGADEATHGFGPGEWIPVAD